MLRLIQYLGKNEYLIVGTIEEQNVENFTVKIKGLDSTDIYKSRADLNQCHANVVRNPDISFRQCIGELQFKNSNGISIRFVMPQ